MKNIKIRLTSTLYTLIYPIPQPCLYAVKAGMREGRGKLKESMYGKA